jgi:NADH:ubiquinone oxidoreductase subunit E
MHPITLAYRSPDPAVVNLLGDLGRSHAEVVKALRILHAEYGRLTPHLITEVARELRLPISHVYGIATFYSLLTTPAPSEKTIMICDGPYCTMRGAVNLLSQIQSQLDESWTITRTSCLGLCDRAPAALVGDSQVGPIQLKDMDRYESGWCGVLSDYGQPRPCETRALLPDPGAKNDPLGVALDKGE